MLSIGVMAQGQSAYYIGLAREDYYMDGGEPPGIWHGQGAEALGLTGQVDGQQLTRVFEGFHPTNDQTLVELQEDKGHRPGWDLTFSAPKSVSVLWSQADQATREKIQEAQLTAVKSALDYLESTCEVARRGKGGYQHEKGNLLFATFEHGTSRAQDPQLHTHALLLNVTQRQDGTFGTLDANDVFKSKMVAGALYRAELAHQLEQSLGVEIKRQDIYFEVSGVPKKLCDEFSKRRAEIEAVLQEKGMDSPEAAAVAALSTRSVKGHTSREELFAKWQTVGQEQGWSRAETREAMGKPLAWRDPEYFREQALGEVRDKVTEQQSTFSEREFVRRLAEAAPGRGMGASEIIAASRQQLQESPEVIHLGMRRREALFTTRELLEIEKGIFATAERRKEEPGHGVSNQTIEGIIGTRKQFSGEQAEALRHITREEGGAVRVVSGMAGTGKTTLLHAARMTWELEGYEIKGACLAGKAAEGLQQEAGIPSETIARTLLDIEAGRLQFQSNSVLVVDEAGMVGTRQMAKLMEATDRAGATLVLIGDEKQLQPIETGGTFPELGKRVGAATLTDIRRQRGEWEWAREAVSDFAYGRAEKGLAAFAKRGLLHIEDDEKAAQTELIERWKVGGIRTPEDQLIFTGTRKDAVTLNRMAQSERQEAGVLKGEALYAGGERFFEGDRVLFTKRSRAIGVLNGSMGEVAELDREKKLMAVRLDNGERVRFSVEEYEGVKLGYAVTSHKGQGMTVERAFILAGGSMQDREITYVQTSRARGETRIFSDRETAGEQAEQLVWQMSQSRAKETAQAVKVRLQGDVEREQRQVMEF